MKAHVSDRLQLIASVSWLLMDYSWMRQEGTAAVVFAVPTTVLSLLAVAFLRDFVSCAVALSMAGWSVMNALWMASDLGLYGGMREAQWAFCFAACWLLLAVGKAKVVGAVLPLFRRLRF